LSAVPKLSQLVSPEDLAFIASIAIRRTYRDGETIHERGDAHPTVGFVVAGRIKLVYPCRDGQEVFSGLIHTGQNYGDSLQLLDQPRVHRAIAIGETVVDHLDGKAFDRLLERPAIVRALYVVASFRLSVTIDLLDEMRTLAPDARLARLILRMHAASGGGTRIDFLQEDFAGMLGVSTVTLAKSLRQLEQRGVIEAGYRHVRVSDPAGLAALVREQGPD
jgi:CRP-like cAMP-binding protein